MADQKNIRLDLILALAANWRSEGEYWSGTREDARSQHCADQLLQAFGLPLDAHTKAGEDYGVLLKAHGVASHTEPPDRGIPDSKHLDFLDERAPLLIKEALEELETKQTQRSKGERPLEVILHEKLGWAFEEGYREGFEDGANARKTRYKEPSKKSPKK